MKLNQSQPKPIKIWLYILLSIPPFLCIYPLKKLKKVRLMLLINLGVLGAVYLTSYIMINADTYADPRFFSYRRSTLAGEKSYGRALSVIALAQ